MKILILRTWATNIGNTFIEKGAREWLKKGVEDPEITEIGGYSYRVSEFAHKGMLSHLGVEGGKLPVSKEKILDYKESKKERGKDKVASVGDLIELEDFDLAVIPGCVLYPHVLEKYESVLDRLEQNSIPVIILGAGAGNYSEDTVGYVKEELSRSNIKGMISRNPKAYSLYRDSFEVAKEGIDAAFFIDEWYEPPAAEEAFIAYTYDKRDGPDIDSDLLKVRPDHNPFGRPFGGFTGYLASWNPFDNKNTFLSDNPRDYLFVYANSEITYSDRVHACVPTLVYGNEAYFDHDTPRSGVFEAVFDRSINNENISLKRSKLKEVKKEAVKDLEEILDKVMAN